MVVLAAIAALIVAGAAPGSPSATRPCPATCIHVGSTLNPVRASAAVGAPVGFLAVDGRKHRLSGAFFSVTALRAKDRPPTTLEAWKKRNAALRANLLQAWGGFPAQPAPLDPRRRPRHR